ncbi:MAG: hypothetical protein JF597_39110 [Streptomyces sp.]|uniref:hypothetical protein n=1 Tax=Streptomyces sp. TaxID=1931 RepID=UPI00260111DF|nr:hypothetical protein [Streptomyces sp.]MBW8799370.1 hypothetical protein [Streptomyces sp.]
MAPAAPAPPDNAVRTGHRCGGKEEEYYRTRLDGQGRPAQGDGVVLFRGFYDLAADPYQLTDRLHGATAEQEAALGIPELAKGPAAARRA